MKNLKIGDVIEWEGKNGEKILVEVTKPLTKLNSNTDAEIWSKKEGWSVDYFNSKVKSKLNQAWQIEYKLLENQNFIPTQTPTLTRNFAGVGTRDIENYNTLDKTTNKWTPREEYVGKEKEEKAKQAIRDVYENTLNSFQPKSEVKPVSGEVIPAKKEITKEDTDKLPPCIG